ncbi:hypothetical protein GUITHDRAFT_135294 [Guillardia theta CCMP2712]|uniref:Sushi domain-containing protein n=1 Tax=Guillardia theta (strain CCMP2712) TaxID=905079 RepID=L1JPU5_GUITC|nr:hypothetical protein GUITHDRAFT_135294 [Guillardia theta CCMP2712]EKX50098.1 hypothetical protein GUITHDRAFT_135294 [Guillardia theta CCMP2712]|eukprot:XP_005837078.1 hypothetical protein GUITHDRAFT_135294 [Guillardia theta CCMP2712]
MAAECNTVANLTCDDGTPAQEQVCTAEIPCGCGTGPCVINTSALGHHVANWSLLPVPPYGQNGFWAKGPYFDQASGSETRLNHKVSVTAMCEEGYRVVMADSNASVSSCDSPRSFNATCDDCSLTKGGTCAPIVCDLGELDMYTESIYPGLPATFGTTLNITCKEGYRPGTTNASAPRWYTTVCRSDCQLTTRKMCMRVICPISSIPTTIIPSVSPLPVLFHDDNISFSCITGYHLNGSSCWSGDAMSYIRCLDGEVKFQGSCSSSVCGCSYAPCYINESSHLFANVMTWNVSAGTELSMDGGIPQVLHGGRITLSCKDGYRPKLTSAVYPPDVNQTSDFEAQCMDCSLMSNYTCEAVACESVASSPWLESISLSHPSFADVMTVKCKQGSALSMNGTASVCTQVNASYQVSCDAYGKFEAFQCLPMLCPDYESFITDPNLVRTNFSEVHVNGSLQVKCRYGFRMGSRDVLASPYSEVRCLPDCTFTSPAGCLLVQCGALQVPTNATAELIQSNFSELNGTSRQEPVSLADGGIVSLHGDIIRVTCSPGYHVRFNNTCFTQYDITCTEGNLSQVFECIPIECGVLELAEGEAYWNKSSDKQVNITCKPGYRASGPPASDSYLCNKSRTYEAMCEDCYWDRRNLSCNKVRCPPLTLQDPNVDGEHAYVEYSDVVNATCKVGFRAGSNLPNASKEITALCNDMCAYDTLACLPVVCASTTFPNHLPSTSAGHLSNVTLSCVEGYRLGDETCSTSYQVTCEDGEYPATKIRQCVRAVCNVSDIGDPYIEHLNTTYDFSENVTVTCKEGYRAVLKTHSDLVNCSESRSYEARCGLCGWEAEAHCQRISCACSYAPCHINESSHLFANVMTWNVSAGTELSMDGGIPQVLHGGRITLSCKDGYRPKLTSAVYPPDVNQTSDFEAQCMDCSLMSNYTCEAVACESVASSPWLESISLSHPSFADVMTVKCKQGSALSMNGTASVCTQVNASYQVSCDAYGKFEAFQCLPMLCPDYESFITDPNLVRTNFSEVHVNGSLQVKCRYGFRMGSRDVLASPYSEVRCLPDCTFTSPAGCLLVQCGALQVPTNATAELIQSNFSELNGTSRQEPVSLADGGIVSLHGDIIRVTCSPGYHVRFNNTCFTQYDITCTEGNLSQVFECIPIECGVLELAEGEAYWNKSSDKQVNITCKPGYRASGPPASDSYLCNKSRTYEAMCEDCYWDRRNLSCNKVRCPPLTLQDPNVDGEHAYVEYSDVVNATCKVGFRAGSNLPNASKEITALCNDMCAYDTLACLPVVCASTTFPNHLPSTSAGHLSNVTLSCVEGYRLGDETCSTSYQVTCEDGEYPATKIRQCVRAVCNVSDIGDPYIEHLNTTYDFSENVTVTCKEGYRAVLKTHSDLVNCSESRSYEARCGLCGWEAEAHCQRISCLIPLYGDPTVIVEKSSLKYGEKLNLTCRRGLVPANFAEIFAAYGASADCLNAGQRAFEIGCEASCNVSNELGCVSAFCPDPQLGWIVNSSIAVNQSIQVSCSGNKRFDGQPMLDAMGLTCTDSCQYKLDGVTGREKPYSCGNVNCTSFRSSLSNAHVLGGGAGLNETTTVQMECDLGYAFRVELQGTTNDSCTRSSSAYCYDTQMQTACSREIPCGCGTGPCVINTSALGHHVANWSLLPVPPYGQNGFWAKGPYFDQASGSETRLNHKVSVTAMCEEGYRVVMADSNASVSSCDSPRSFNATCDDCSLTKGGTCAPIVCDLGELDMYTESIYPGLPATFGTTLNITCKEGYRPGTTNASAPRWYTTVCRSDCTFLRPACGTNYSTWARIRTEGSKIILTFQSGKTNMQVLNENESMSVELEVPSTAAHYHVLIDIRLSICSMSIWMNDKLQKVKKCLSGAGIDKWADESGLGFYGRQPTDFPVNLDPGTRSSESILKPFLRIYEADLRAVKAAPNLYVKCKLCVDQDFKLFVEKSVSYDNGVEWNQSSKVWWNVGSISIPNIRGALIQFWECKSSCFMADISKYFPDPLANYLLHGNQIQSKCDFNYWLTSNQSYEQNVSIAGNSRISSISSSEGTASFYPIPTPDYGVNGFWSTQTFLDNETLQHRASMAVECKSGYRKADRFARCLMPQCLPVQCESFIPPDNGTTKQSGRLTFGKGVAVDCPIGTRAMPTGETSTYVDTCSYNRTYYAVCNDACGYDSYESVMLKTIHSPQFDDHLVMQCQMISCPAFLAAVQVTNINSRAFGEVIEVHCLTGYRMSNGQLWTKGSINFQCPRERFNGPIRNRVITWTVPKNILSVVSMDSKFNSIQPLDDPYAENWTSVSNELFSTVIITCKEGYRASTGVGIVTCNLSM